MTTGSRVRSAEVVLPCRELESALPFYTEELGFRVDAIFPADNPVAAVLSGYGLRLRLDRAAAEGGGDAGVLRLLCDSGDLLGEGEEQRELLAPNGTRILILPARAPVLVPEGAATFELTHLGAESAWVVGRAGMQYRDLLPGRQGDRFVASHIRIPTGGPVPDYVHFHRVRFQMIFCYRGWVRVAYEDQGPPIVMEAGDCVLQPPEIRHRVLECSPGLEVIEIGCPSQHETFADHDLTLPTEELRPERLFGKQRFLHHRAAEADWTPWRVDGFECKQTGMVSATNGLAGVCVIRPGEPGELGESGESGAQSAQSARTATLAAEEFLFYFVLRGTLTVECAGHAAAELSMGAALAQPEGATFGFAQASDDLELLEVRLPAGD